MPNTPVRGIRLPNPIWEALQREATNNGVTPSELIRQILQRHTQPYDWEMENSIRTPRGQP